MLKLLINGRFLTRPMTGVDRTAEQVVRALSALAATGDAMVAFELEIAVPAGAPTDEQIRSRLDLPVAIKIHRSRFSGYVWEQLVLSRLEPEATLLSLCNIGPVLRRKQLAMIHDAQIYDAPHSYSPAFRTTYRLLQPLLARRANTVVTVSQHSRGRLQAHGLADERMIHVIYNGVDHICGLRSDPEVLGRLGLTPGEYLLALCHPAKHKNIAMLVRACGRREDRQIPLVLAGQGHATVLDAGTAQSRDCISVTARLTDNELKALYESARLFLFPSLTEGFGFPLLEAMSCGCPVIATTGGATPEIAGSAAVLCDPSDEAAWTRAVEALQFDTERLADLSERGRAQAEQFTWRRTAQEVLAILSRAAPAAA